MKVYEIYDEENKISIGALLYYEKEKTFVIELEDNLNEWTAPLLLTWYVKQGIFTIPRDISFLWVKERVIPPGRQNIDMILKNHKLKCYDEMKLLELQHGRCSHDGMCIKKSDELPEFVTKRINENLKECLIMDDYMICFFNDEKVRKVAFSELTDIRDVEKVMNNRRLKNSGKVGTGGYCVTFNESIDIAANELRKRGKPLDVSLCDFEAFVIKNAMDTSEACNELDCSRQNLSYMLRENQLDYLKENVKGNLYLKGAVQKVKW